MSSIVALGLNENQESYITQCKSLGYHLIGFDRDRNAKCVPYCDEYYNLSIDSIEIILGKLKGRRVIGILSEQTDSGLITVGRLNSEFSLLGLTYEASQLIRDKYQQRRFIEQHKLIKQPIFALANEVSVKLKNFTYVLKKPRSGQSSSGVGLTKLEDIVSDNTHIYEEFVRGIDFSLDGIFQDKVYVSAYCVKEKFHDTFVDKTLFASINAPTELVNFIENTLTKLNVNNVFFHAEFKKYNNTFYLVEFTTRGGGSGLSTIVASYLTGLNMDAARIDLLVGHRITNPCDNLSQRRALMHFGKWSEIQHLADKLIGISKVEVKIRRFSLSDAKKVKSGRDRQACIYILFDVEVADNVYEVMNGSTKIVIQ